MSSPRRCGRSRGRRAEGVGRPPRRRTEGVDRPSRGAVAGAHAVTAPGALCPTEISVRRGVATYGQVVRRRRRSADRTPRHDPLRLSTGKHGARAEACTVQHDCVCAITPEYANWYFLNLVSLVRSQPGAQSVPACAPTRPRLRCAVVRSRETADRLRSGDGRIARQRASRRGAVSSEGPARSDSPSAPRSGSSAVHWGRARASAGSGPRTRAGSASPSRTWAPRPL